MLTNRTMKIKDFRWKPFCRPSLNRPGKFQKIHFDGYGRSIGNGCGALSSLSMRKPKDHPLPAGCRPPADEGVPKEKYRSR
jgi:hypothetical protein